ncbi:hypothetical protein [Nonomuraea endophytica]|uniref:Uncharacterized protein n=1 Tax=Nonomuraea endophytica TaxID=714136 RepID=A0A7W8AB31_9ACTN|nr:hypothetical protein [Nonomuraea endophytica]MBB5082982.1 hypothetical protein [Nonomuraea endophytica]
MDELARLMARHDPAPHEVPPDELLLAEILGTARPRRCSTLSWRLTFGAALATGLVILAAGAIPTARAPGQMTVTAYFRYPGAPLALCGEPGSRPRKLPGTGGGARRVVLGLAETAARAGRVAARGHGRITVASSLLRPGGRTSVLSRQWTPLPGRRVEHTLNLDGERLVQAQPGREGPYRPGPSLPADLLARLSAEPETYGLLTAVISLNETEILDAPRTAAMWRVLADRPGLRTLGRVTDRRERRGQGVAFDVGTTDRWVLVADRGSGDLLGVERVMLRPADGLDITPPCVRDFWTFLDRATVATVGD